MQHLRILSLLLLLLTGTLGLRAQNGNAVVSEIKIYDMGNGTGIITARISGNQAYLYTGGGFTATGTRIPGGTVSGGIGSSARTIVVPPSPGNGNGNGNTNPNGNQAVILAGVLPLSPSSGQQSDFITVDLRVAEPGDGRVFYHWGSVVSTSNP